MQSNCLIRVVENDWLETSPTKFTYRGKFKVGRFQISDAFILEYLMVVHDVEIPDSWLSQCDSSVELIARKIMYMEASDFLTQDIIKNMRNTIKNPPSDILIFRDGNHVVKIKKMDDNYCVSL